MDLCRQMADWHILLWAVPFVVGILMAAIGSRVGRRVLIVLSLMGLGLPLVQASAAAVFLLWGPGGGDNTVHIGWMTERLFVISFRLDSLGVWAVLVAAAVGVAAQVYALAAVARFAGRHRFFSLQLMLFASGVVLFTGNSMVPFLVGWEGLAITAAFLAGFWESEQRGERTGMRWLLFQRTSGLLLLMGLIGLDLNAELSLAFLVAAVCMRAGQLPFHGWLPDSSEAPAPASALLYGTASTLASVFILARFGQLLGSSVFASQLLGGIGLAGVGFGLLAGLQQHQPEKALGWLFVLLGGFTMLAFAVGDTVAALILVTSQSLVLAGAALAIGSLVGPLAAIRGATGKSTPWRARRGYFVLAAAWMLPPSLGFVGLGRLLSSATDGPWGWSVVLAGGLGCLAIGWIGVRIHLQMSHRAAEPATSDGLRSDGGSIWRAIAPASMACVSFALGILAVSLHGLTAMGGVAGLGWAGMCAGAALLGAFAAGLLGRHRLSWLSDRLTPTQRLMERIAETGLGVGELLVKLPVLIARALGVLIWRVVGDVVIDTLVLGTAFKTVEGIGIALRILQNGRIQRYALVAVLAVLVLVASMLR